MKGKKKAIEISGLQPCSWRATTPISSEPANQGGQGYLIITDRCVAAGLELKPAGQQLSRSRVGDPCHR